MARRIRENGPWGWRFPSFEGVGFHVIQLGTPWLITDDSGPVMLRPRDIVFAGRGTAHALSHRPATLAEFPEMAPPVIEPAGLEAADVDFLCGAYRLDQGQMPHLLRLLPRSVCVLRDYDRHPDLRSLVGLLEQNVSQPRPGAEVTRAALIDLLLVRVLTVWRDEQRPGGWPAIEDAAVAVAIEAMHENPQAPWTVPRLSALTGISRAAFTRRFISAMGKPPMAYLIGLRLSRAAQLLRETGDPLAAIAHRVGYTSEFAFAAAFRREFGIAPGRFRSARTSKSRDQVPSNFEVL